MKSMTISEWYGGRTLLVTGGTGFMGKVLLEKLLRSCQDIKRIYVLVRPKRGCTPAKRIQNMTTLPLFERIHNECPEVIRKLVAIEGDMTQKGLGLSTEDRSRIISEVSVVFHGAASLRLEAGLKDAILHNTVSTERLLQIAKEMTQLEIFVHLSTAFCHCEEQILFEKIYPTSADPQDVIRTVNFLDETSLQQITPRLIGVHPNSYTYSKRLAETLVEQYSADIPVAIVRPSIVLPTMFEPIPGWVDTLNGPIGVMVGGGKGVIRTMMCGSDFNAELIPVDIAINCIIAVAWHVATEKPSGIPVFNVSQANVVKITWGEILATGLDIIKDYPFDGAAWYPDGTIYTNRFVHYLLIILLHTIPAYLIDFLLTLARQKRFMVRIQKRISVGLEMLQYFTMRTWSFRNEKMLSIGDSLSDVDKEVFYGANVDVNIDKYILDCILGARVYCMKEPLSSLPKARRHMAMLYWVDRFVAYSLYALLAWTLFTCGEWLYTVMIRNY